MLSGVLVITRKNAVHSALALIVTLLAQAALYLMLYAPFVAGVQIILYAGGIMVLFLFVIMLVNIEKAQKEDQFNKQWLVGLAGGDGSGRAVRAGVRQGQGTVSGPRHADAGSSPTPSRSQSCSTAITCSPSRSPRCCCWWRSSEPCDGEEENLRSSQFS